MDARIENDSVEEIRERLKNELEPEMYKDSRWLQKFLKAQDYNVDLALKMLKNHLEWRKKVNLKNIRITKHPEVLRKYASYQFLGYDKEGCVIRYIPSGNTDWVGLVLSAKEEDILKNVICNIEDDIQKLKEQTKKLGKPIDQVVLIHDLENFSFAAATNKKVILTCIGMTNLYQNNYPEGLKAIFIINASIFFSMAFAAVKPYISSSNIEKFRIYWDDSYKKDLLEIIDADVLPSFLGGNRTDPDGNPKCTTFISYGGKIPDSYYIHKSKRSLANAPGTKKVTLSNAAFHEVKLEVTEPGSYLEWEFETKSRDVGFGLFFQNMVDGEEENVPLIPIQRVNTDEYAETGLFLCEKEGTYVIVFDNTYSWLRAKEIFYKVKVTSPSDQENCD